MAKVLVTGGTGFLGSRVVPALKTDGHTVKVLPHTRVDLRNLNETTQYIVTYAGLGYPQVVHLAYPGSKGGIATSQTTPFTLAADLLRMDANVIEACAHAGVTKLLCVGSACAYPEHTPLPTSETSLWDGYPEPVNAAYGIAKRTQLTLLQAARRQYGLNGIHVILGNLYGPGDRTGHVIPSLITKVRMALRLGGPVVVWGHPEVTRSFLYVADAADGLVRLLRSYDSPEPLNLMSREEIDMQGLVGLIAYHLNYTGQIIYDTTKPTGHLRRAFDTTRLREALRWEPPTPFLTGLRTTIDWQVAHVALD